MNNLKKINLLNKKDNLKIKWQELEKEMKDKAAQQKYKKKYTKKN